MKNPSNKDDADDVTVVDGHNETQTLQNIEDIKREVGEAKKYIEGDKSPSRRQHPDDKSNISNHLYLSSLLLPNKELTLTSSCLLSCYKKHLTIKL